MVVIDMYHTFSAYLISVQLYKENVRFGLEYHRNHVLLVHLNEGFIILVYLLVTLTLMTWLRCYLLNFFSGKIFLCKLDFAER